MDAPIQALENLGIPFRHVFASDVDPHCLKTIEANHAPEETRLEDITKRVDLPPEVDLYVCGFPCQPFSKAGNMRGLADPRGTVFHACVEYISTRRPKHFILENVAGLMTNDEGRTWEVIRTALEAIPGYAVSWSLLRTCDYGVPQSRKRLYIVGVRDGPAFTFPEPVPCAPQEAFVDADADEPPYGRPGQLAKAQALGEVLVERGGCFFDVLQYRSVAKLPNKGFKTSTCLLTTSYVWCVPMRRWATLTELLSLQGFPTNHVQAVSNYYLRRQIGNAMSVNVLEAILSPLLLDRPAANLNRGPYRR